MLKSLFALSTIIVFMASAGCSKEGAMPTEKVTGTVTFNGEKVTGGTLMFDPVSSGDQALTGKPGAAEIQADGTFAVSTYGSGDGAVVGDHTVSFSPPSSQGEQKSTSSGQPSTSAPAPASPYVGLVAQPTTVTIKEGEKNVLEIKLVKP